MELDPARPSSSLDRRHLLKGAAGISAAALAGAALPAAACAGPRAGTAAQAREVPEPYTLPALPFAYNALEPVIGARIMELHQGMHHRAYVDKLCAAIDKHPALYAQAPSELLKDLNQVPEDIRQAVRDHGGGHVNHSAFLRWMVPPSETPRQPEGELAAAIASVFGDQTRFQEAFNAAGGARFGSGWVWLVWNAEGRFEVLSTPNQDSPISSGSTPLLGNDVWEHAYYLTYENRRGDYLKAWWRVVDWQRVGELFLAAKAGQAAPGAAGK
jgi:superoxide dismutase, Fe-Mn family